MMTSYPAADLAIENGQPLKELVPLFPSRVIAYEYYAEKMAERFLMAKPECADCGQRTDVEPLSFVWRANVHTAKTVVAAFIQTLLSLLGGFVRVNAQDSFPVAFATHHRLCPGCRQRYHLKRATVGALHYLFFVLLFIAFLITALALLFFFVALFYAHELLLGVSGILLGGSLISVLLAIGHERLRRWPVPSTLRRVGQFPFALEKAQ